MPRYPSQEVSRRLHGVRVSPARSLVGAWEQLIVAVEELLVLVRFASLHERFGTKGLLAIMAIAYCVRGALYMVATEVWHIYAIQLSHGLTFAIHASASAYYADEEMAEEDKTVARASPSPS